MLSRRTVLVAAAAALLSSCGSSDPNGSVRGEETDPANAAPSSTVAASSSVAAATTAVTTPSTAATSTTTAWSPGQPSRYVKYGSRTGDAVALTFHAAGDTNRATRLLDVLARSGTRATMFGIGQWMAANPRLVQRMVADGHEIANHTWSHPETSAMTAAALESEIARCAEVIRSATGSIGKWFRPSAIEVPTPAILAAAGKVGYPVCVGYDVDSVDFRDPGTAAVVSNTVAGLQAGAIVSLHFDHENTIEALPTILAAARQRSLRPVTLTGLLG
jgi:peptidoglycan/xylan/chitin deacetylase (PgdA/CDA1 family)